MPFRLGMSLQEVFEHTKIDPWFLVQIEDLVREERAVSEQGLDALDADRLRALKRKGFADQRLADLLGMPEAATAPAALRSWHAPGLQAR